MSAPAMVLIGRPVSCPQPPSCPVEKVLSFIDSPANSPAYIRAVIGLVDEIVDQIECPRSYIYSSDPDLSDTAYAAAELRKTLEKTRDYWDLARIAEIDQVEKGGFE